MDQQTDKNNQENFINKTDLYTILSVDPEAGDEDIKAAYRAKCRVYHPDKSGELNLVPRLIEIQEAYRILSDPYLRQHYDRYGFNALDIAKTIRDETKVIHNEENALALSNQKLYSYGSYDEFSRRVVYCQKARDEIVTSRVIATDTYLQFGIVCNTFNPCSPLHRRQPPISLKKTWDINETSIRHIMTSHLIDSFWPITASISLGHRKNLLSEHLFLQSKNPSFSVTPVKKTCLDKDQNQAIVWCQGKLSTSGNINDKTTGSVDLIFKSSVTPSPVKIDINLRRSFESGSVFGLGQIAYITTDITALKQSSRSTIQWMSKLNEQSAMSVSCTTEASSALCLFDLKSTYQKIGNFGTQLIISSKSALLVTQFLSFDLRTAPDRQYNRSSKRNSEGFLFNGDHGICKLEFGTMIGTSDEFQIFTRYAMSLSVLDPFLIFHYSVSWHPRFKCLSVGFRFERLGTHIDIPVTFASSPHSFRISNQRKGVTSRNSDQITENFQIPFSLNINNWRISDHMSVGLWSVLIEVAALGLPLAIIVSPILLHRLMYSLTNSPYLSQILQIWQMIYTSFSNVLQRWNKKIIVSDGQATRSDHKNVILHPLLPSCFTYFHYFSFYSLSPLWRRHFRALSDILLKENNSIITSTTYIQAMTEQLALKNFACNKQNREKQNLGLVIIKAFYGDEKGLKKAEIELKNQLIYKNDDNITLDKSYITLFCYEATSCFFDVTIPMISLINHSKITLRGGTSKQFLPGFWNPLGKFGRPSLFIIYRYGQNIYMRIFDDYESIIIP